MLVMFVGVVMLSVTVAVVIIVMTVGGCSGSVDYGGVDCGGDFV